MRRSPEFAAAATRNVEQARVGLAVAAPRTREANTHLVDIGMFDELVERGRLATSAGGLDTSLSLGGLCEVAFTDETVQDVRAALRAYGQWLIAVADNAY